MVCAVCLVKSLGLGTVAAALCAVACGGDSDKDAAAGGPREPPAGCAEYTSEFVRDACQGSMGCVWNDANFAFTRTATDCSELDDADCATQRGCSLR